VLVLSKLLDVRCITLEMRAKKKEEAIQELVDLLYHAGKVPENTLLVKQLLDREKMTSTGIGNGIAIPHDFIGNLPQTVLAFGRKKEGIPFDAIDQQPVNLFFLLVGPERNNWEHLKLLSKLARLLHDNTFKNTLFEARRPEDILEAITAQERESA